MDLSLKRHIGITASWVSNRISLLDDVQKYEESYALTQEFREWLTCPHQDSKLFKSSVMEYPNHISSSHREERVDLDELLEL